MYSSIPTEAGMRLAIAQTYGLPFTPQPLETLNEIYHIYDTAQVSDTDTYQAQWIAIGNRGHQGIVGADNEVDILERPHRITDGSLYGMFPWIIRPVNNDLPPTVRDGFGLRVLIQVGSSKYWGYYLRRLDLSSTVIQSKVNTTTNGVTVSQPYVPNQQTLTPQPPVMDNNGIVVTDGSSITVNALNITTLSANDIAELINVATILYSDPNRAFLTEVAVVSGIRKSVNLLDASLQPISGQAYNECLRAICINFTPIMFPAVYNQDQFVLTLDLGTNVPLFGPDTAVVQTGN